MMTKVLLLFSALVLLTACNNVTKTAETVQKQLDQAIAYNDFYTAIYYAHELLNLEPSNKDSVLVQLANLYQVTNNYSGAIKVADEVLDHASAVHQVKLWKIKATAHNKSAFHAEAIRAYEKLIEIDKTNDLLYLYEIGVLYFQARDVENGVRTMEKVTQHPKSQTEMTTIRSDWGNDQVPYFFAAKNYIGYVKIEMKDFPAAEAIYNEIASAGIEFNLAKGNAELLKQRKEKLTKSGQ